MLGGKIQRAQPRPGVRVGRRHPRRRAAGAAPPLLLNFEGEADEVEHATRSSTSSSRASRPIATGRERRESRPRWPLRFDDDFLKKLEYLHVVSKRAFAGQNRADRLHAEARPRHRVRRPSPVRAAATTSATSTGRPTSGSNRLLLRLFDEEQDLPIYLMLDVSRSMAEPAKFDMARRIAAALCYIGLAHLDRLTILPFGRGLGHESSPGRGKGRIFRVFEMLERLEAAGTNRSARSRSRSSRRGRGSWARGDHLRLPRPRRRSRPASRSCARSVTTSSSCTSRRERDRDPGAFGDVRFVDAETGDMREIEVTPRLAAAYVAAWEAHAAELEQFLRTLRHRLRARRRRAAVRRHRSCKAFRQGRFLA